MNSNKAEKVANKMMINFIVCSDRIHAAIDKTTRYYRKDNDSQLTWPQHINRI